MPIDFIDFTRLPIQRSGLGELIPEAMESYRNAYETAARPKQLERERQKEELALAYQQMVNQYYPQLKEQEMRRGQLGIEEGLLNLEHLPKRLTDEELQRSLALEQQRREGNRDIRYGEKMAEAELAQKLAQAYAAQFGHLTAEQKIAAELYGKGTPEYYEHLGTTQGVFPLPRDEEGRTLPLPKNAIKMQGMTAAQRTHFSEAMRKDVERGESAKKANEALEEIEDVLTRYPKLNRSMSYLLAHPSDEKLYARAVKGLNPDEQAAVDIFVKNAANLALYQSETGNQRATNLYRQMVAQTKPGVGLTEKANRKIIDQIRRNNEPLINYANQAAPFIGTYYIPFQSKNYENKEEMPSRTTQNTGGYKGTRYSKEEILQAAKEENKTEQEVIEELLRLEQ